MIGTYLAVLAALLTANIYRVSGLAAAVLTLACCLALLGVFALLAHLPALARRAGAALKDRA